MNPLTKDDFKALLILDLIDASLPSWGEWICIDGDGIVLLFEIEPVWIWGNGWTNPDPDEETGAKWVALTDCGLTYSAYFDRKWDAMDDDNLTQKAYNDCVPEGAQAQELMWNINELS